MILTDFLSKNKGWIVRGQSAAVDFNSMQEFSAEKGSRLPDEPIEKGSFATYNRVIEPRSITARLSIEGGASKLQSAIDRLTDLCENDETITLTTPEQSYKNMMLESFDYRRDSSNGRAYPHTWLADAGRAQRQPAGRCHLPVFAAFGFMLLCVFQRSYP